MEPWKYRETVNTSLTCSSQQIILIISYKSYLLCSTELTYTD